MGNPGLKKHTAPMTTPRTNNIVPPEPVTVKENVMKAPGTTGVSTSPPVPATNGAEPILDYQPISATQPQQDPNRTADQRRIEQQKQVGGGAKENSAWERAQNNVQEKMQRRRAHPLFNRTAVDDHNSTADLGIYEHPDDVGSSSNDHSRQGRDLNNCETCWLKHGEHVEEADHNGTDPMYNDEDDHPFKAFEREPNTRYSAVQHEAELQTTRTLEGDNLRYFRDTDIRPPTARNTDQGMLQLKSTEPLPDQMDEPYKRRAAPGCETCWLERNDPVGLDKTDHDWYDMGHKFKPFSDAPNARYSALVDRPNRPWEDESLRHFRDTDFLAPEETRAYSLQPMFSVKHDTLDPGDHEFGGNAYEHSPIEGCETCWLQHHEEDSSEAAHSGRLGHPFKPFEREPNARFSALSEIRRNEEDNLSHWRDPDFPAPVRDSEGERNHTVQPMIEFKKILDTDDESWDQPAYHDPVPGCETCHFNGVYPKSEHDHRVHPEWFDHEYKSFENAPNARYSALFDTSHPKQPEDLRFFMDSDFEFPEPVDETTTGHTDQPMFTVKNDNEEMIGQRNRPGGPPVCETCWLQGRGQSVNDKAGMHERYAGHPFKPLQMVRNERYSHQMVPYYNMDEQNDLVATQDPELTPPSRENYGQTAQPLLQFKRDPTYNTGQPFTHTPGCETCYLNTPEDEVDYRMSPAEHAIWAPEHPFKPFDKPARYSAQHPLFKQAESDDEWWDKQPDVEQYFDRGQPHVMQGNPTCETCHLHGMSSPYWADGEDAHNEVMDWGDMDDHPYKPLTMGKNERFSSTVSLVKTANTEESDEDFWARMEREYPGGQPQTEPHTYLSPDAYVEHHPEPRAPWRAPAAEDWDDPDYEGEIPDNMSSRDHVRLVNSGVMRWNGATRYPEYSHEIHRTVRTADGDIAHAKEGHVIEHNTHHSGPVSDPDAHPLQYQWTHSYYPAGLNDNEGLTRGYNTPDEALKAAGQLSVWGPRHPESSDLLQHYRKIGDDSPYDPMQTFPHEFETGAATHLAAFDVARGEYLYNIDKPNYHMTDRPPSASGSTNQGQGAEDSGLGGMGNFRRIPYGDEWERTPEEDEQGYLMHGPALDDSYWHHTGHPACAICEASGIKPSRSPLEHEIGGYHSYRPIPDTKPGERLAAYDPQRKEFLYDIDAGPNYFMWDRPPSSQSHTKQPMMKVKNLPYENYYEHELPTEDSDSDSFQFDSPYRHKGYGACETCFMKDLAAHGPNEFIHTIPGSTDYHPYKPVEDLPSGERLAAVSYDPVDVSTWENVDTLTTR